MGKPIHGTTAGVLGVTGVAATTLLVWSWLELGGSDDEPIIGSSSHPQSLEDSPAAGKRSGRGGVASRASIAASSITPASSGGEPIPPGLGPTFDPQADAPQAAAIFEEALARLDRRLDRPGKVSHREWVRLYRQSNDALATWSIVLDPREPDELQMLEDARLRLATRLEQLEPRVAKPRRRHPPPR